MKKNEISARQAQLEREKRFDEDILPFRTDNARVIDGNYNYNFTPIERIARVFVIMILYLLVRPVLFFGCGYRIRGKKNLKGVKGAIVVSNHAFYLDCLMVQPLGAYSKMYHTGAGFNSKKGIRGEIFKLMGYLPLNGTFSAQKNLSEKMNDEIKKGGRVHFYPEHALWNRYTKPRPFKSGAFRYAVKFSCPVIPTFITFESTKLRRLLRMKDRCVINVMEPIYIKEGLSQKENTEYLRSESYKRCVEKYEEVYKIPLSYESAEENHE